MKTKKVFFGFLMILSVSISVVSCGKEVMSGTNVKSNSTPATEQIAGAIVDLGPVAGDVHVMNVSLSNVSLNMSDLTYGSPVESSQLKIDLLTQSDGIISDGTYLFSDTTTVSPFTFKTASVMMPNTDSGIYDAFDLSGGSVTVARTGTSYNITLDGTLSNGNAIQGTFSGVLSYSD